MGAIKDIVDLCVKLRDENRDGKISAVISEIQSLTLALQSEQAAIAEKNSELLTENLDLKRKLLDAATHHSKAIAALQEKHRAEIAKITASNAKPKDELDPKSVEILKHVFDHPGEFSSQQIASIFKLKPGVADFHIDKLLENKFIDSTFAGVMGVSEEEPPATFEITSAGREYIFKNGLA